MKPKWTVFALFFCYGLAEAQTNEGTEFWLSFLEHRNPLENTKVAMITSRFDTRGRITAPLADFDMPFTVKANDVTIITLPPFAENIGSEIIRDNGIRVTSENLISVYIHQYFQYRAEATIVLPVTTIGREYFALSYAGYFTEGEHFPSQFVVVATEDATTISVTFSADTEGGRSQNSTFEILLNAGETYQIQGDNDDDDLSGTYLIGDKDFSLFCGNRYSALNCFRSGRDNLLEQSFSLDTWGTRFVSAPFQHNILDIFRVLGSEDSTQVEVYFDDGSKNEFDVDRGEFFEYETDRLSYIQATKPLLVAQYMNQLDCANGFNGDPSMLYLNSILQIRDTVTLYNSTFQNIEDNFINVIAREDDLPNIEFDGQPIIDIVPAFQNVGLQNEFASAIIEVNSGAHTITSSGCGVIAKAYGLGNYESYAYSGGARFSRLNASPIPDGGCLNDTVFFDTGLPEDRYDVQWVFENGEVVSAHKFSRIFDELGAYSVYLYIHDICFDLRDSLRKDLQITLRQSVATDSIGIFCEGESIALSATDVANAAYEWIGPDDFFAEEQSPLIENASLEMMGTYEVIGIVSGCATFPAFVDVEVKPNPIPDLGADQVFCPEQEAPVVLNAGEYLVYNWSTGSDQERIAIQDEGTYTVTVVDTFGCKGVDSIFVRQQCPTRFYIPNAFTPNGDGVNDSFGIFGEDIIGFQLLIFDRWGNQVFESVAETYFWDGTSQGNILANGVYPWLLILEGYRVDGSNFIDKIHGNVTLIR